MTARIATRDLEKQADGNWGALSIALAVAVSELRPGAGAVLLTWWAGGNKLAGWLDSPARPLERPKEALGELHSGIPWRKVNAPKVLTFKKNRRC